MNFCTHFMSMCFCDKNCTYTVHRLKRMCGTCEIHGRSSAVVCESGKQQVSQAKHSWVVFLLLPTMLRQGVFRLLRNTSALRNTNSSLVHGVVSEPSVSGTIAQDTLLSARSQLTQLRYVGFLLFTCR